MLDGNCTAYMLAESMVVISVVAYLEVNASHKKRRPSVPVPASEKEQAARCGEASADGLGDGGSTKADKTLV